MTNTTLPLNQLISSAANVRKTGGQSIEDIAASIEAHGLIHNLTVRAAEKGKYEVVAGGRRLAAMKALVKTKKLAKDHPVPCLVIEATNATEISLAENTFRQAMHPADQFEAFNALAAQGMSPADIAARFCVSERHVQQLLKLASVSPELVQEYRDEKMTLETLMAFTVSDDHKKQVSVWKTAKKEYGSPVYAIKKALLEKKVSSAKAAAKFVGQEAYLAAGGHITRDLFSDQDETYFDDPALLSRLALEKLETFADTVRAEGWSWVDVRAESFSPYRDGMYPLTSSGEREFTPAETAEMTRLTEEIETLERQFADSTVIDDHTAALQDRIDALSDQHFDLERIDRDIWTDAQKAAAGAVVFLDWHDGVSVTRGLSLTPPGADPADDEDRAAFTAPRPAPKQKPEFSASLLQDLTIHRTLAIRIGMIQDAERGGHVALNALLYSLIDREWTLSGDGGRCVKLTAERISLGGSAIRQSPAYIELQRLKERWGETIPGEKPALWDWLQNATLETKIELLAYLIATGVDLIQSSAGPRLQHSDELQEALPLLDIADWWTPTVESFTSRVSKDQLIKAIAETGVKPQQIQSFAAMKKAILAEKAAAILANERWLPSPLKTPPADQPEELEKAA